MRTGRTGIPRPCWFLCWSRTPFKEKWLNGTWASPQCSEDPHLQETSSEVVLGYWEHPYACRIFRRHLQEEIPDVRQWCHTSRWQCFWVSVELASALTVREDTSCSSLVYLSPWVLQLLQQHRSAVVCDPWKEKISFSWTHWDHLKIFALKGLFEHILLVPLNFGS